MTAPVEDTVYAVVCPSCDWTGMSDDVNYGHCPWCGGRVKRERRGNEMNQLQEKWAEAEANPGKKVSIGSIVVCDVCDKDYTNLPDSGGFIFTSSAYCPKCEAKGMSNIRKYGEERYIRAYCPAGVSFADFIRQYRGENNFVLFTKIPKRRGNEKEVT